MAALTGRGLGGVPFAAERDRFVRDGIPRAVYELCVERAGALRRRAFAAAALKLWRFLAIEGRVCGQERSV